MTKEAEILNWFQTASLERVDVILGLAAPVVRTRLKTEGVPAIIAKRGPGRPRKQKREQVEPYPEMGRA